MSPSGTGAAFQVGQLVLLKGLPPDHPCKADDAHAVIATRHPSGEHDILLLRALRGGAFLYRVARQYLTPVNDVPESLAQAYVSRVHVFARMASAKTVVPLVENVLATRPDFRSDSRLFELRILLARHQRSCTKYDAAIATLTQLLHDTKDLDVSYNEPDMDGFPQPRKLVVAARCELVCTQTAAGRLDEALDMFRVLSTALDSWYGADEQTAQNGPWTDEADRDHATAIGLDLQYALEKAGRDAAPACALIGRIGTENDRREALLQEDPYWPFDNPADIPGPLDYCE